MRRNCWRQLEWRGKGGETNRWMIQAGALLLLLLPGVLLRRNLWKGDKTQDSRGKAKCKAGPDNVGCIRPGLMWDLVLALVLAGAGQAVRCCFFPWSEVTDG